MLFLQQDPYGSYRLDADIDMSGTDWVPCPFYGTLDGAGHAVYNLDIAAHGDDTAVTIDGNDLPYDTVFAALFSQLIGGTVRDLKLQGVVIDITTEKHCYAAAIAGYMEDAVLERCTVEDTRISLITTCREGFWGGTKLTCMAGVGGLAGFGSGRIADCTADVTLIFEDKSADEIFCEEFLGGILANGNAAISACTVTLHGYDACRGYAHNGGLVGMFYVYDKSRAPLPISGCRVDGTVTFFEDNPDRRAYCKPYVGELLSWTEITDCSDSFTNDEIFDYSAPVHPEKCADPVYSETVVPPSCTDWGFTTHTCEKCGNTWRDSFTSPHHTPGEWVTVTQSDYNEEGLSQLRCGICGELLEEKIIAALVPTSGILLSDSALSLRYKEAVQLSAEVIPENALNTEVLWSSSDETVASVDPDGTVHAMGRGNAVITCFAADGFSSAVSDVTVSYTPTQWLIKILLFGWIWY